VQEDQPGLAELRPPNPEDSLLEIYIFAIEG